MAVNRCMPFLTRLFSRWQEGSWAEGKIIEPLLEVHRQHEHDSEVKLWVVTTVAHISRLINLLPNFFNATDWKCALVSIKGFAILQRNLCSGRSTAVEQWPGEQILERSWLWNPPAFVIFKSPSSPHNELEECPISGPSRRFIYSIYENKKNISNCGAWGRSKLKMSRMEF